MVLVWDRLDALTAGAAKTAGAAGGEFKEVSAAVLRHVLATQDLDHHGSRREAAASLAPSRSGATTAATST